MRIKDPISEAEEPFNLIPLTDMVFNLLIFFMAATTFAQVEKDLGVQLPRSASFSSLSAPPKDLTINIDEKGVPRVRQKKCSPKELADMVATAARNNNRLTVIIRADKRGVVEKLDEVLDICKRAGINKVDLSYVTGGTGAS